MNEIDRLVKMANQIADNFGFHDDPAGRVEDHLRRFWAPSMRQKLITCNREEPGRLNPPVREAARRLAGD